MLLNVFCCLSDFHWKQSKLVEGNAYQTNQFIQGMVLCTSSILNLFKSTNA